ncbi:MAG TPA: hypothetical protein VK766_02530 [Cytophagaceae bacterium]|jgi:hypothetical protein|nr:hypothetical protein [Cytophagaceae bacterium]
MKSLVLLFAFIVFVNVIGNAQDIPAKSNAIVVVLPDSNKVSDKILKVLTAKEYTITPGKNPSVITTAAKTLKSNTRVVWNVNIKGAEVILTGKIVVAGQGSMTIEYKGTKGTPMMNGWEEMDKIAKALGGKVSYEIK